MHKKEIIEYNILFCFTESFILIDRRMCERRKQKTGGYMGKNQRIYKENGQVISFNQLADFFYKKRDEGLQRAKIARCN